MNRTVMLRLFWKDAKTAQSLVLATVIGLFACYAMLFIVAKSSGDRFIAQIGIAFGISLLFPNIFAYSIPAFLVGTEEESGSLAWLRNLPTSWSSIATSKFACAVGAVAFIWTLSAVTFGLFWLTIPEETIKLSYSKQWLPNEMMLFLLAQLGLTFAVMLVSLITSYVFRSPILALLAAIPLLVLGVIAFAYVTEKLVSANSEPSTEKTMAIGGLYLIGMGILFLAHQVVAWRRLVAPESNLRHRVERGLAPQDAYRPSSASSREPGPRGLRDHGPATVGNGRVALAAPPSSAMAAGVPHRARPRW